MRANDVRFAVYDRLPHFSDRLVPEPSEWRFYTDACQQAMALSWRKDAHFLEQRAVIHLASSTANAVGTAGAGQGGFGLTLDQAVDFGGVTGVAQAVDLTYPLDTPRVVASATAGTISVAGTPWTVNQWVGKVAVILAGTGATPTGRAVVLSNTTSTLTLQTNLGTIPNATSVLGLFAAQTVADGTQGVVTDLARTRQTVGYATKLNAQGSAYLDLTTPLIATIGQAVPVPMMGAILGVQAWRPNGRQPVPIDMGAPDLRGQSIVGPAWTKTALGLFLLGESEVWAEFQNLEVFYQPIHPAITAWTDVLLLPDHARELVASIAGLAIHRRLRRLDPDLDPSGGTLAELQDDQATVLDRWNGVMSEAGVARVTFVQERF